MRYNEFKKKHGSFSEDETSDQAVFDKVAKMNPAQQSAYMQKHDMPNDEKIDPSVFKGNKEAEKIMAPAKNKDGTYSFAKGISTAVDTMMPMAAGVTRDVGKFVYRDAPGKVQKWKKEKPEEFQQAYDQESDVNKQALDKALQTTPAQAKADYKKYQADMDKQFTDQGLTRYGYNLNTRPVVNRFKNAGAWIKDKFNEDVESNTNLQKEVAHFVKWASQKLYIQNPPKIQLSMDTEEAQQGHHTGRHVEGSDTLWVYAKNRNLVDILRTVFHELVHWRQTELGMIEHGDSYPGSAIEAMADMLAGKYIKIYGKQHRNIFQ